MPALPSPEEIARELGDYGVELSDTALKQLQCYLELLVRWNRRINLTAIRTPPEMVRRLFGESLFLARVVDLEGWLVDVGSGAGFPGLALKLAAPELRVTLVESRRRKCAFLKEVAQACRFDYVDVVAYRFEDWAGALTGPERSNICTTRAVTMGTGLLTAIESTVAPGGKVVFSTSTEGAAKIRDIAVGFEWLRELAIPGREGTVVLVGRRAK